MGENGKPIKKLTLEFDGEWVLSHRDDEVLPVAALEQDIAAIGVFDCKDSTLTSISVLFDENSIELDDARRKIYEVFASRYPSDNVSDVLTFCFEDVRAGKDGAGNFGAGEKSRDVGSTDAETGGADFLARSEIHGIEKESEYGLFESTGAETGGDAMLKIGELVGAYEFKSLAKEIAEVSREIRRKGTYDVFTNRCYLFSIGDGCGLSTYLELLARLIGESGLCKLGSRAVREEKIGALREGMEPFEDVLRVLGSGDNTRVMVLCVDISEWMDNTENRFFKHFLRAVEKHADEFIVVFRVPFVDKEVLYRIRYSLSDLLSVREVAFPPLSEDEIKRCAQSELKRYDFGISPAAWKYFFARIAEEKSDGKFYGLNTVKKVVKELIYVKQTDNAGKSKPSDTVSVADAKKLCGYAEQAQTSGSEQLEQLVGSEGIKARIYEIISQIEYALRAGEDRPCIHMRFVGNPGTGKTTVARIMGKILKEKGVLRVGNFYEYAGRDFCGRYIGETAPKTASICRDAYGSVLFIDEAYSLYRGDDNDRDYGKEAIDTLIAEMENHRSDFVVIMAGYTDDMNRLMGANLGLASRMPYTLEFPNFTREQLYEIFEVMAGGKLRHDRQLLSAARDYFLDLPNEVLQSKEFSNARFVRNLFERTWAKAAMRCQLGGLADVILTKDDFLLASADREFSHNVRKKVRLGF